MRIARIKRREDRMEVLLDDTHRTVLRLENLLIDLHTNVSSINKQLDRQKSIKEIEDGAPGSS